MKKAITVGVYDPRLIYQASPYCGDNVFAKGLEANEYKVTSCYRSTKLSAHWCIDTHWTETIITRNEIIDFLSNIVIIDQSIALIVLGIIWRVGLFI